MRLNTRERKFFVETEVEVPDVRRKIINTTVLAKTKEDAIESYTQELNRKGFSVLDIRKKFSVVPGIVFLGITVIMSFFRYFEKNGFNYIELYPDILSLLLSLVIYSAFVIRIKGIDNVFKNISDTVISILFVLVMGIVIKIFAGNSVRSSGIIGNLLGKIGLGNSFSLVIAAIVLSWLGLEKICGFIWIAIIVLGIAELVTCGNYMGNFKGSIFLLSLFLGGIFYLKYEGKQVISSFKRGVSLSANVLGSNINESKRLSKEKLSRGIKNDEEIDNEIVNRIQNNNSIDNNIRHEIDSGNE